MKNWPGSKKNQCHFYDKNRNTSIDTRLSYYTENIEKIKAKNYYKADNQKIDEIKKPKDLQNKNNSNTRIKLFIKLCKEGPTFVCVICNMCQKLTKKT